MTQVANDLSQYAGKKIVVTIKTDEGTFEEVEGFAESANVLGILLKPKGKSAVQIIDPELIERVDYAPEKAKSLAVKYLKEIEFGGNRQHLLDRHSVQLAVVNAMDEASALELHQSIDHGSLDLGHRHGEKPVRVSADSGDGTSE